MKAYFNRRVPFYLLSEQDLSDSNGFDSYPVEVDEKTLANVRALRRLVEGMEGKFETGGAPEEVAQEEAEVFEKGIRLIMKTRAQINE